MYTFVVGHWCENTAIALFKLLYLHMGLLEVIQFQNLFSLLMRSRERFELRAINLFTLLFSVIKMIEEDKNSMPRALF